MAIVTAEVAAKHCRADLGVEDDLIALYLAAAVESAADYLNRQLFETKDDLDAAVTAGTAGENPMIINGVVKAAVLLTLGHLYANREDVVVGVTASAIPMGARSLLRPHRVLPGV